MGFWVWLLWRETDPGSSCWSCWDVIHGTTGWQPWVDVPPSFPQRPGGCPSSEHAYKPTHLHTNRLLGRLAHTTICKTNTGNDRLLAIFNCVSALQLPRTAEDHFQQWYGVGRGKEIFTCLTLCRSDISIWRQDGSTPIEINMAFHQFFFLAWVQLLAYTMSLPEQYVKHGINHSPLDGKNYIQWKCTSTIEFKFH